YVGYLYFNMEDPVVGGEVPERVALRRAVLMGYDVAEEIRVVRNGQGVPATQPIPPDAQGHVPGLDIRPPYDPAAARALLDKFGNRRWADLAKMAQQGQLQVWMLGNTAYTGDAMMFALYGPNANNLARF